MPDPEEGTLAPWALAAAERSPAVERSRRRSAARVRQIVDAARRLVMERGSDFTTHELVKEAGIAVQTLYKHFPSKDHVILAVLEDVVATASAEIAASAAAIDDPRERLRVTVMGIVGRIGTGEAAASGKFVAAEHWRLARLYPEDLARVSRPVADLLTRDLQAAVEAGQLPTPDPAYDGWLTTQLLLAVFHHYTFTIGTDDVSDVPERVWAFCWRAWGGSADSLPAARTAASRRPRPRRSAS